MWLEKLLEGVLRVLTPLGPRYLKPSLFERLYLLWVFRNFQTLPIKVLTARQLRFVDAICNRRCFVSQSFAHAPLLGTLEQRPPLEATGAAHSHRRPNASVTVEPLAANQHRP